MADKIRIMLIESQMIFCEGTRQILRDFKEIEVAGEARSRSEAARLAPRMNAQVLLLDLLLAQPRLQSTCQEIRQSFPDARILLLGSTFDDECILDGMEAGVDGFLLKDVDGLGLASAIKHVVSGGAALDPRVARRVMELSRPKDNPIQRLSVQEKKVLALVAEGKTNKEIGINLVLSEKTVRNYLSKAMDKLNASRRAEAGAFYIRYAGGLQPARMAHVGL